MNVIKLSVDDWSLADRPKIIENPSFGQIESYIDVMDGDTIDSVCLGNDIVHICAGSGEDGQVVCFVMEDDGCYILNDIAKGGEKVEMQVGGQPGHYPAHGICGKDTAKTLFAYYLENRIRHPGFSWKRL